uniref:Putative methyltransferase n=1 Tax=viral metagenome TaxID=1070528 RepID=A0A6M3XKF5_9ZZZZ
MTRRLHIGGQMAADSWELFNITENVGVDHVGNAKDLSRFRDRTFGEIYSSHVLEHFDYRDMPIALKEWHRVLDSQGKLFLSVPNLDVIFKLFLDKEKFNKQERIKFIQMVYGGHVDNHDIHNVGFDRDIILDMIRQAGFAKCEFVKELGIFNDCSKIEVDGQLISLNLIAHKEKLEDFINPPVEEEEKSKICKDVMFFMSLPRLCFTDNMFSAINAVKGLGLYGERFQGVFWEQGMENLLEKAIDKGYKYGLAIDYDTFYTMYHVLDLYNIIERNPDVGIISPLQPRRGNKYPMSGTFQDPRGDNVLVSKGGFDGGIKPVDTAHFGLTMIRLSELSKLKKPWFQSKPNEKGDWHRGHKDADVNFWIKCKSAGIKAALAEVWIGHLQLMCSFCGPVEENFVTYHEEINTVLEGGLPKWTIPKSFKEKQVLTKS